MAKVKNSGTRRLWFKCVKAFLKLIIKRPKYVFLGEEFCEKLLYSKRVALVPGTAFGESGEGFVRASYCYSVAHIKEALERVKEFLDEIRK